MRILSNDFDCIVPSFMKDIKQKQIIQMEIQVFLEGQNFATKYVAMLVGVIHLSPK